MWKYIAVLVLFLSIPTAWAGSIDGKGIWCDHGHKSFGYWFQGDEFIGHRIENYNDTEWWSTWIDEYELGTREIKISTYILNRKTLVLKDTEGGKSFQCYLVTSREELKEVLQAIADKAKAENKI